jgi:hypothetical protein
MTNLKKGEIWVCKEPYCAAEIEVTRSANGACHGNFTVRCCCGKDMTRQEAVEGRETVHAEAAAKQ